MTLAERVVYERLHGKGSAPEPQKHSPSTLSELRKAVEEEVREVEIQKIEIESKRAEVEKLERSAATLRAEMDNASTVNVDSDQVSSLKGENKPPLRSGVQHCVTPAFALKKFFTDWSIDGRSARSEIWWVALFVNFPMYVLASIVGNSELAMMLGIIALVLLWPNTCMEGRRFHDLGINAGVGVALVLIQALFEVLANIMSEGTIYLLIGRLIGFVLLLFNVAQSQQHANRFGEVPNVS